jgi:hypothetical protein
VKKWTEKGIAAAAGMLFAASAAAQDGTEAGASGRDQARMRQAELVLPPEDFATAEEHYRFLYEQADGGTEHTMETIPVWEGLWASGNNTMPAIFLENGTLATAWSPGAEVREGVLRPAYEAHFKERRAEIEQYGEQRYDRLTNCEYPGVPRWLWEPYVKEFVNMPHQSWFMNDMMNETRRIYIGKEHVNIDGRHFPTGDSIGFWDDEALVVWTKWVNPADYVRGMPLTSNQFEMVETWEEVMREDGTRELVTQVTFYDPVALTEPQSAVYTHQSRPDLEEVGVRIRNWECQTSSNSYKDEDGNTQFYLPGDPEYKDPRGFTDFPDIPGQSLNPIFDAE